MHPLVLSRFGHTVRMTTVAAVENNSHRNIARIILICVAKFKHGAEKLASYPHPQVLEC